MQVRNHKAAQNPANSFEKSAVDKKRIPMSTAQLKLSVPEIPGYHLHWMMGTPSRIAQAMKGGYTFVESDEVDVVNTGLADDASKNGNTDMGSRVSLVAGSDTGEDGKEQRLYLMKIPLEYWEEDQQALESKNEQIASTLRGGGDVGGNPNGSDNRYVPEANRKAVANMFTPKRRQA
jgi:hypothetical protein